MDLVPDNADIPELSEPVFPRLLQVEILQQALRATGRGRGSVLPAMCGKRRLVPERIARQCRVISAARRGAGCGAKQPVGYPKTGADIYPVRAWCGMCRPAFVGCELALAGPDRLLAVSYRFKPIVHRPLPSGTPYHRTMVDDDRNRSPFVQWTMVNDALDGGSHSVTPSRSSRRSPSDVSQ
jgi:hypothetical protein